MNSPSTPSQPAELVLVGGGHSHLVVIKQLGQQPLPGVKVTLISKHLHTPYSGMLPGVIAGHYQLPEASVDLKALCQWAGIRFVEAEVTALDADRQSIHCHRLPAIHYDYLSINTGSEPALGAINGAAQSGIAIKPIEPFLLHWQQVLDRLAAQPQPYRLAIVGGGAASVEIALACQYRLHQTLGAAARLVDIQLLCGTSQLLAGHNRRVQAFMRQQLTARGIRLKLHHPVHSVEHHAGGYLLYSDQDYRQAVDEVIWAVHAGSPRWPQQAGLHCDDGGFIRVNHALQSLSHPTVFAAGDIAHFSPRPLAKSGVYAVRAGYLLADNLRRLCRGQALLAYRPQRRFLSLLMTGDQQAIASKGRFYLAGRWVWRWKDWIDRRFMAQFVPPATAVKK